MRSTFQIKKIQEVDILHIGCGGKNLLYYFNPPAVGYGRHHVLRWSRAADDKRCNDLGIRGYLLDIHTKKDSNFCIFV